MDTDTDSLDLTDPELIKFMNSKLSNKPVSFLDIFLELIHFAFDNYIVTPYNYIYDYIANRVELKDFLSEYFTNSNVTFSNKEENDNNKDLQNDFVKL